MISAILIAIAAIFNGVMDILENENFSSSRFANCKPEFWYKRESWKHAKKVFGWKFDGWHCAKSLMVVSMVCAVVFYQPILNWWADILIYGAIWNGVFGITYKLLKT